MLRAWNTLSLARTGKLGASKQKESAIIRPVVLTLNLQLKNLKLGGRGWAPTNRIDIRTLQTGFPRIALIEASRIVCNPKP